MKQRFGFRFGKNITEPVENIGSLKKAVFILFPDHLFCLEIDVPHFLDYSWTGFESSIISADSSMFPAITVRILLNSWAIPPPGCRGIPVQHAVLPVPAPFLSSDESELIRADNSIILGSLSTAILSNISSSPAVSYRAGTKPGFIFFLRNGYRLYRIIIYGFDFFKFTNTAKFTNNSFPCGGFGQMIWRVGRSEFDGIRSK